MPPDMAFVKEWCRIDGTQFDAVLPSLIVAATTLASHETGNDYQTTATPAPVAVWIASTCAYWLDHPDTLVDKRTMPSPFLAGLLDPYRTHA